MYRLIRGNAPAHVAKNFIMLKAFGGNWLPNNSSTDLFFLFLLNNSIDILLYFAQSI